MLQNHYFIRIEVCCSADIPFNIDIQCTVPCMSSKGKVKIVPSKLSLLCPLVSLECAAKWSSNTAALSWELEFFPHRHQSKMETRGYAVMCCFFSDEYRSTHVWTKSVLPTFRLHTCLRRRENNLRVFLIQLKSARINLMEHSVKLLFLWIKLWGLWSFNWKIIS